MKIVISNTSENPLYQQIKDQIKDAILREELVEGDALPSIRSFANDLKVSVLTIRRVYDELEKEIDNYMYYYNNERYQYNLAKLSPNEYLEYYKTGNYPLKHIIEEPIEYKKKFSLVKQNLDRNLTFKKLTSVIIKISHLKQTIG